MGVLFSTRRSRLFRVAVLTGVAVGLGALGMAYTGRSRRLPRCSASSDVRPTIVGANASAFSATRSGLKQLEYVIADGRIGVYDFGRRNRLVQQIEIPRLERPRGVVASPNRA